ncbi:hypothetical protein [Streptomyces sp. NPDC097619]|uniref:hypothetical protein n=1 Tax=Streptomyces sp. NPDC097619 TaxID=3157228 RepID=UPI00331C0793
MDPALLVRTLLPLTALLYGTDLLLARRTARRHRAVLARWERYFEDPYRAAAERWWVEDETQAAAAELVLAGLVTVTHRGNLVPTPDAADPARAPEHPLPRALLAAVLARTAPAPLGAVVLRAPEFGEARTRLRAERPEFAPPVESGCLTLLASFVLMMGMFFVGVALMDRLPQGAADGALAVTAALLLVALIAWFPHNDRARGRGWRGEHAYVAEVRTAGPHPALAELAERDPQALADLGTGRTRTRRGRNRGRPRHRARKAREARRAGGAEGLLSDG